MGPWEISNLFSNVGIYPNIDFMLLSPSHIAYTNPLFAFNTSPMPSGGLTEEAAQQAREYGRNQAAIVQANMAYSASTSSLDSLKNKTEQLIKTEGLTAEHKNQLNQVLKAIEELRQDLDACKNDLKTESDKAAVADAMLGIQQTINELPKAVAKLAEKILAEVKAGNTSDDNTEVVDDDDTVDDTQGHSQADDASNDDQASQNTNSNTALGTQSSPIASKPKAIRTIVRSLYSAVDGMGTNVELLDSAMSKINKDNVIDVLNSWNTSIAPLYDGETLVETLYNETKLMFSRDKYTNQLVDALQEKADEKGIDIDEEVMAIISAQNSFFGIGSNQKVWENIQKIHEKLGGIPPKSKNEIDLPEEAEKQEKAEQAKDKKAA